MGKPHVIAIVNLKGGVGKTVTAVNLAYYLGAEAKKILVVDMDPQSNATEYFLPLNLKENPLEAAPYPTIENVLLPKPPDGYLPMASVILPSPYTQIDLVPCSFDFSDGNERIMQDLKLSREFRFKSALAPVLPDYDYVLIDLPPSLGTVTINALLAATDLIIPLKIDRFAIEGVRRVFDAIDSLRRGYAATYTNVHILFTVDERTRVNAVMKEQLASELAPGSCFETTIRKSISIAEASFSSLPVALSAPNSTSAQDYQTLAKEVLTLYA